MSDTQPIGGEQQNQSRVDETLDARGPGQPGGPVEPPTGAPPAPAQSAPRPVHAGGGADATGTPRDVPEHPDPPQRHQQDTKLVDGDAVLHPPPEADLTQKSKIQG